MPNVIEQLERYASALEQQTEPVDMARIVVGNRRLGAGALALTLATSVLVVAGTLGALALGGNGDDDSTVDVVGDPNPVQEQDDPAVSTTPTTGIATRTLRFAPVALEADGDYLVWAGEAGANDTSQRGDGFEVALPSGTVQPIPVAPIDPRSGATGVWTGSEAVVCCGAGEADGFGVDTRSAAAWDPTARAWREVAAPPDAIARSFAASVWTGEEMIVVAKGPAAAAYDPVRDQWRNIPAPPIRTDQPEAVWTGQQVVVWDGVYSGQSPATRDVVDRGWMWTPGDDQWQPLPDLPEGQRTQLGSITWTGSEVVVWGLSAHDDALGVGARWTPGADIWDGIALSPQGPVPDPFNGTPGSQAITADPASGLVLVRDLDGGLRAAGATEPVPNLHVYDPASDAWHTTALTLAGFHPEFDLIASQVLVPDEAAPILGAITPGSDPAADVEPDPSVLDGPHISREDESAKDVAERVMADVLDDPAVTVDATDVNRRTTVVRLETSTGAAVEATVVANPRLRRYVLQELSSPEMAWDEASRMVTVPEPGELTVTGFDGRLSTPGERVIDRRHTAQPGKTGPLDIPESSWIHLELDTADGRRLHFLRPRV